MSSKPPNNRKTLLDSEGMQNGRKLVDDLRDGGIENMIELPQIVVMGDTSSGKSSVLSALSGVPFPSANVLTTRCPTQLNLSHAVTFFGSVHLHRFAGGNNEHTSVVDSMADVPKMIEKLTKLLVDDEGQYISDDKIVIKLQGPELPNLTLTDLPGLVRTVSDKEDACIIERVKAMVHRFMTQSRTIILAIVPANVDMHNTEILQAAQSADPHGSRTIAVVTKLDLVDNGAENDVLDLLQNKKKKMKLGYHAVRCRSQKELNENVSIAAGMDREQAFFDNHPVWCRVPISDCGVPRLSAKLVEILQDNIHRVMPVVIKEIDSKIENVIGELERLGTKLENPSARRQAFIALVARYVQVMRAAVKGEYDVMPVLQDQEGDDLHLRARIRAHEQTFQAEIEASKSNMPLTSTSSAPPNEPEEESTDDKQSIQVGQYVLIRTELDSCMTPISNSNKSTWRSAKVSKVDDTWIQCRGWPSDVWISAKNWKLHPHNDLRMFIEKNRGDELAIFPSYRVFSSLCYQWIAAWVEPSNALIEAYKREIFSFSNYVSSAVGADDSIAHFLNDRANEILLIMQRKTKKAVFALQSSEQRPYTQDQALFTTFDRLRNEALEKKLQTEVPADGRGMVCLDTVAQWLRQQVVSNDDREAMEMEFALQAYMDVASKRFIDEVPMRINALMLEQFINVLDRDLASTMDDKLERLMAESSLKAAKRAKFQRDLERLKNAKVRIEAF